MNMSKTLILDNFIGDILSRVNKLLQNEPALVSYKPNTQSNKLNIHKTKMIWSWYDDDDAENGEEIFNNHRRIVVIHHFIS